MLWKFETTNENAFIFFYLVRKIEITNCIKNSVYNNKYIVNIFELIYSWVN